MHIQPIRAVSEPCLLGESPMWHPQEQVLYWCDIPARRLHRLDPVTGESGRWEFAVEPACCAPALGGGLVLGMRDGLWWFDPVTSKRSRLARAPYDPATERFNDGKCDPQGRMWVGTIYEPRDPPRAALYRWSRERGLDRMAGDITVSNGLAWSPDGATLYWSDTKAHEISALDFQSQDGSLSRRRMFASFPKRDAALPLEAYGGRPDGAAVDVEGCYWVAMFEGQRVLRLSPQGEVLLEVPLPVRCPTMPCFGGPDLRTLYITTARDKRPEAELMEQPLAGCVLALQVEVAGLPSNFVHT
ncbi:sugar lactone lactonase YvrE [Sphaerotilus hippei]|uniref:Sugar lactone lactonase YvrE n=1 Tax=Sphaerotilus hippei TaxID=744406 RepID=A0A318GXP1_9BURK|nr:SMP-30/gluconolactonase/LRE family protein [Sphaerotilus hippei]PXW94572.1 sugar lactone lactonase YvrE [Sphaerotilus hippei]